MSKDPAVLFYPSDFLTGTRFMTYDQIGRYMTLLCLQQQQGHFTEDEIMQIADDKILRKFIKDEQGLYYNERMEKEIIRRKEYSKSRLSNLGNVKDKPHMENHMQSHMGAHMEIEIYNNNNIDIKRDKIGDCKGEEKREKKEPKPDIFAGRSFSERMKTEITDWLKYKAERRDSYKETGLDRFLTIVENKLKVYSEADIANVMGESMANNWAGVAWNKLKQTAYKNPAVYHAPNKKEKENYDHLAVNLFADEKENADAKT